MRPTSTYATPSALPWRPVCTAAVLKAHGWKPTSKRRSLDTVSRAEFARIDLHFHDLRREAGSRWLEGGVPLHTVRDWLGHTSIVYLASSVETPHEAMRRFD